MLTFQSSDRISVEEALAHPYLAEYHMEDDEPVGEPVSAFDFDYELFSLDRAKYKQLLFEETQLYHSQEERDKYKRLKQEHPNGYMHTRFPKDKLRTMYKEDPTVLAIFD